MIIDFYVYSNDTGEILRTGFSIESEAVIQNGVNETVALNKADDKVHYHDLVADMRADKLFVPYTLNKTSITADGSDTAAFTSLPTDTLLTVLGETETEVGGAINFSVDLVGTYTLLLTHPIHLDTEVVITAT